MIKKKFFIFVSFIMIVFALLTFQGVKSEGLSFNALVYPLKLIEKASSAVTGAVTNTFRTYLMLAGKEKENRDLIKEINRFKEQENRYAEAELENERLKSLLKLKSARSDYVAAAAVFARDATNWFQTLWIDKGADDGIAKNMVAVTPLGPVGRVYRVLKDSASIILVTDVNSSIAVRLQSSRVEGILEGKGDGGCYLNYISKDSTVEAGDIVVTSGLEGLYPGGLVTGHVKSVTKDAEELFQIIEVVPSQDLNAVEEVVILKR
jgi:rod shape-determining protein MreC